MEDVEIDMEESGVQKFVDRYWDEIVNMKPPMGHMRFHALVQVMAVVLSLSRHNVDWERPFSGVRKVHRKCHQNFNADTTRAL